MNTAIENFDRSPPERLNVWRRAAYLGLQCVRIVDPEAYALNPKKVALLDLLRESPDMAPYAFSGMAGSSAVEDRRIAASVLPAFWEAHIDQVSDAVDALVHDSNEYVAALAKRAVASCDDSV